MNPTKSRQLLLPALAVVLGATTFATAGVFVKTLGMSPLTLSGYRLLVPALILFMILPGNRKRLLHPPDARLWWASLFTALRVLLWVMGLLWAPMSKAIVILFCWPIIHAGMVCVLGYEKANVRLWLTLTLALVGVVLVQGVELQNFDSREFIGLVCMSVAAFLYACNTVIYKLALIHRSALDIALRDCLVGSLIYGPFVFLSAASTAPISILGGIVYGAVIGVLGYGLMYWGLSRLKGSTVSVLCYAEVLVACLLGVLVFGEQLQSSALVGIGCILLALFLLRSR